MPRDYSTPVRTPTTLLSIDYRTPIKKLQDSYQGTTGLVSRIHITPIKRLQECVLTGNSKQYLGKAYTKKRINELSEEEVDKLFGNYEAKLSGQMVKSLGKSIIKMYSMGACAVLGMNNQDALSEDLESDPFLNSALQRFTCELYYRFGSFLAPHMAQSVGIITSRHYLSERGIKNGGRRWKRQT